MSKALMEVHGPIPGSNRALHHMHENVVHTQSSGGAMTATQLDRYFAFPPSGAAGPVSSSASSQPHQRLDAPEEEEASPASQQRKAEEDGKAEKARLEREAEARRGEEAWVRSGGVLRDARGMRDVPRTEAVRAELRLRDWEEGARGRWEAYESGWRALLGGNGGGGAGGRVRFVDIPWPVGGGEGGETRVEDLSVERVEEFLLEGLRVRGSKVTRRERVRGSLLRWHPDKMTGVLARVEEEDVEKVRAGIRIVTECLQSLNTRTS
ncbi:hypothetical protein FPV67DRAFT_1562126 [Lyophyllum atratum]|nr:hypothetical protein FPV67DRAFT_1562126 [Lyophyllum atratum]